MVKIGIEIDRNEDEENVIILKSYSDAQIYCRDQPLDLLCC